MNLGERLKYWREKKGFSQPALAEASGVPGSAISRIESGQRQSPGIITIEKLSKALGVSPSVFFQETGYHINLFLYDKEQQKLLVNPDFVPYFEAAEKAFRYKLPAKGLIAVIDTLIEARETIVKK